MSDAAKPVEQRRGPVGMPHPLETPIDPATGEAPPPSAPAAKRQPDHLPGRDRFNLDPVAKGWFRGKIANVLRSYETTPYGQLMTYTFDVVYDRQQPSLKVEMQGYTFSKDVRPGMVVETHIGDVMPTERVRRDIMRLPFDPNNDLRSHRPVQQRAAAFSRGNRIGVIALIVPPVVIGLLLLLGSLYVW